MRTSAGPVIAVSLLAALLASCSPSQPASQSATAAPLPATAAPSAGDDAILAGIADRLARHGAPAYLKRVDDGDTGWRHLLARLSNGNAEALALAARLRPAADAGTAEALDTAAARGLPAAPVAVLGLTKAGAGVDTLCTSPFIEPEPGVEKRYNAAALAALDRVPAAQRSPAFTACHRALAAIARQL